MLEWFFGLKAIEAATVLLAVWGGIDIFSSGVMTLWNLRRQSRRKRLREHYPDLYDRLKSDEKWMLEDKDPFVFSRLFVRLLSEEVDKRKPGRLDFELRVQAYDRREIDPGEVGKWASRQMEVLKEMVNTFVHLSEGITREFEKEEEERDRQVLGHLVGRVGNLYERAIHLGIRYQQTYVSEGAQPLATKEELNSALATLPDAVRPIISGVEDLQTEVQEKAKAAIEKEKRERGLFGVVLPDSAYVQVAEYAEWCGLWEEDDDRREVSIEVTLPSDPLKGITEEFESLTNSGGT